MHLHTIFVVYLILVVHVIVYSQSECNDTITSLEIGLKAEVFLGGTYFHYNQSKNSTLIINSIKNLYQDDIERCQSILISPSYRYITYWNLRRKYYHSIPSSLFQLQMQNKNTIQSYGILITCYQENLCLEMTESKIGPDSSINDNFMKYRPIAINTGKYRYHLKNSVVTFQIIKVCNKLIFKQIGI